ncbi:ligase-associated DNA damage response endonuclease PdeM [Crateriforma spongiae]|uniref:ligase-associated DNA damage response endonuclease PdeM n=1 Tax=Crateriforma spongiae TaxID=2724528 RepID=UPI0039AEB0E7
MVEIEGLAGSMDGGVATRVGGHDVILLADRGLFHIATSTLFVADLHLGKDSTFRRHGVPVPTGSTAGTLCRVEKMIRTTDARRLVLLGDLFHSRSSLSRDSLNAARPFFQRHRALHSTLILGNHDRAVGILPADLSVKVVGPAMDASGLFCAHQPDEIPNKIDLGLCGHLHPCITVGDQNDRIRLRCFYRDGNRLVLPAVGDFTGGHRIRRRAGDQVWAVTEETVLPL